MNGKYCKNTQPNMFAKHHFHLYLHKKMKMVFFYKFTHVKMHKFLPNTYPKNRGKIKHVVWQVFCVKMHKSYFCQTKLKKLFGKCLVTCKNMHFLKKFCQTCCLASQPNIANRLAHAKHTVFPIYRDTVFVWQYRK